MIKAPNKKIIPAAAFPVLIFLVQLIMPGCFSQTAASSQRAEPDLVIYTGLELSVYAPIIKEYRERTGLSVQVIEGTCQNLQSRILTDTLAGDCDVVFGFNTSVFTHSADCWEPYESPEAINTHEAFIAGSGIFTPFSAQPLVIMYNTRLVTYRELPIGWDSLTESRWDGQIAFYVPDPSALQTGALTDPEAYGSGLAPVIRKLWSSPGHVSLASLTEVNQAIAAGRCCLGITTEGHGESLLLDGADVSYFFPPEGTQILVDGSGIVAGAKHTEQGKDFIDYIMGRDVQYFLTTMAKRRSVRSDISTPAGLCQLSQIPVLPKREELP